jgi:1,4-dihydroxy-2-naphthoate octaprenyltransferase
MTNPPPLSAWVAAARPKTLPAALVPVLVGSASAWAEAGFDLRAFCLALVGALAIQVAANFANDVSDAARGADPADRVGPPRMVAAGRISPRQMWSATLLALGVAALSGAGLALLAGPVVVIIGLASIAALFGYVGGPAPYGYRGLGEVSVFVFFGIVATAGSRFVHDGRVGIAVWILAVPVGLIATAILVANNLRDLETDARAGKRTLVVMIGDRAGRNLYRGLLLGSYLVVGGAVAGGWLPPATLLSYLSLPPALRLIAATGPGRDGSLIPILGGTARLHLLFGVLVAAGLVLGSAL